MLRKMFLSFGIVVLLASSVFAQPARITLGKPNNFTPGVIKIFRDFEVIVFSDTKGVYALSIKCTHRGCLLDFRSKEKTLTCSCHGAKFDKQGKVTHGPAKEDLPWLLVALDEHGNLYVDMATTVSAGTKFLR